MSPDEPAAEDVRFPRQPGGGSGMAGPPPGPPPPAPVYGGPPRHLGRPSPRPGLLARLRSLLRRR
jgi:hypothetical protein